MPAKWLNWRRKDKGAAKAQPVNDLFSHQLVERFHSESALCSNRKLSNIFRYAARTAQDEIEFRQNATNFRVDAARQCVTLGQMQDEVRSVRESQDDIRKQLMLANATLSANNVAILDLAQSTDENEDRLMSLQTMTDKVAEATEIIHDQIDAVAQKTAQEKSQARRIARAQHSSAEKMSANCWAILQNVDEGLQGLEQNVVDKYLEEVRAMRVEAERLLAESGF